MLPEVAVHVIQRGNNRVACFPDQNDYRYYLEQLNRLAALHGCAVHAYCLMPNHVHLLMTPQFPDSCARFMRRVGQLQAQHINLKYERTGSLWEGRFKSSLVQSQSYVLACYRYIELNPVRARLVSKPTDYRWSSFMANAAGIPDPLISPHAEYLALGRSHSSRLKAYAEMVGGSTASEQEDEIRHAIRGGFALGDSKFQQALSTQLGRRVTPGQAGRPKTLSSASDQQIEMDL
jgi:putative transposase